MVNFPGSLDTWSDVTDDEDVVDDSHMNDAHNSLIEIEKLLNLLSATLSTWKIEKDYIWGFEVSQTSVTECVLTSGCAAVNGTLIFKDSATNLDITSDLRGGESEQANDFYNIYVYISGTSPVFKMSNIDPNPDFSHPNESGWRAITGIPNISGDLVDIEQHGDFISFPSSGLFGAAPSGALQAINAQNFVPNFSSMLLLYAYVTATAGNICDATVYPVNNANTPHSSLYNNDVTTDKAIGHHLHIYLNSTTFYFKVAAGNWAGLYLRGAKLKRRRS